MNEHDYYGIYSLVKVNTHAITYSAMLFSLLMYIFSIIVQSGPAAALAEVFQLINGGSALYAMRYSHHFTSACLSNPYTSFVCCLIVY